MTKFIVRYKNGTYMGKTRPVASKKAARRFHSREEAKRVNEHIANMFSNPTLTDCEIIPVESS